VTAQAKAWRAPILDAPAGRRDTFVEPYFRRTHPDQVAVIVKGARPRASSLRSGKRIAGISTGRKVTKRYRGTLETLIEDLDLPNPVIRSYYRDGSIKQYVRDHLLLRTEATSNNVRDFGVPKAIDAVPQLREAMAAVTDRYQSVQQDILETFVDRGQLRRLAEPTRLPNGKRVPSTRSCTPSDSRRRLEQ
jgi:hypothetical protein